MTIAIAWAIVIFSSIAVLTIGLAWAMAELDARPDDYEKIYRGGNHES